MKEQFDIFKLNDCFKRCQKTPGYDLQLYSDGFKQILNFFALLGKIFTFVGSDVADKVRIIDEHCGGPQAEKYRLIEGSLKMEKEGGVAHLNTREFASVSRTLLRLHRAMEFIARLFESVSTTTEMHLGALSKDIYQKSLAKYHPFMVRKAAEFGMVHGLPYRDKLMEMVAPPTRKEGEDSVVFGEKEVRALLCEAATTLLQCHAGVEQMYSDLELHSLP